MFKKSLILITAYFVIAILSACCNCKPGLNASYTISKIDAFILEYKFPQDSIYNGVVFDGDSLLNSQYGIGVRFEGSIVQIKKKESALSLINKANACDCVEDYYTFADSIQSLKITTINNFDSAHLAGSDVTAYFSYIENNIHLPIDSFIIQNQSYYGLGFAVGLYLEKTPKMNSTIQFDILVKYKSGKEQEARTRSVYLY